MKIDINNDGDVREAKAFIQNLKAHIEDIEKAIEMHYYIQVTCLRGKVEKYEALEDAKKEPEPLTVGNP